MTFEEWADQYELSLDDRETCRSAWAAAVEAERESRRGIGDPEEMSIIKLQKDYPQLICFSCGDKYGRWSREQREGRVCTVNRDTCDICGEIRFVTEPRDFGGLKPEWKNDQA